MGKGTIRTKPATNVRNKSKNKKVKYDNTNFRFLDNINNKDDFIRTLSPFFIQSRPDKSNTIVDRYFFTKNKRTNKYYKCICNYGKPLCNWSDEYKHKKTIKHQRCLYLHIRQCRE